MTATIPPSIQDLTRSELEQWIREHQWPVYRARQVWHWLYQKRVEQWDAMGNVPAEIRRALADAFLLVPLAKVQTEGNPPETRKFLVQLPDGQCIEEVIIPAGARQTVCVSSQVGCKYSCAFCASGKGGFARSLSTGEMVGEVLLAMNEIGGRPDNLVWMGMGEPLDNYDNVIKAIRIVNDPDGLAIGARRITISTCGLVPGILRLAEEHLQIELSISLHATTDALRSEIMPVNRLHPLAELLAACVDYHRKTDRVITFEYTLIKGINDSTQDARALASLIMPAKGRVNVIPLSPVEEFTGTPPTAADASRFLDVLQQAGVNATLRLSKGSQIKAACGQLRRRTQ